MTQQINFQIQELKDMKSYPKTLFYRGNLELLKKRKIGIVGSRKPNKYSSLLTHKLSNELSKRDIVIVSGAAMGVDAIAHKACESKNAIAVVANGLDIKYPSINKYLIEDIEKNGLILSSYTDGETPKKYSFVLRNEIVVALSEILIVTHADEKSGTLSSINYALEMGKKVYSIPHQIGQSEGTQKLIAKGLIEPIYNLENFLDGFGKIKEESNDLFTYLNTNPSYDEAVLKYKDKIFELELEGRIFMSNGIIKVN